MLPATILAALFANWSARLLTRWYDSQVPPTPPALRDKMNGFRPDGVRALLKYKARPLNGIWATPPYLHNGSVPNLYALLSPVAERPKTFYLGNREYDPVNVGYRTEEFPGGFKLDTSIRGNRTPDTSSTRVQAQGIIGPLLTPDERRELIEYLKSLERYCRWRGESDPRASLSFESRFEESPHEHFRGLCFPLPETCTAGIAAIVAVVAARPDRSTRTPRRPARLPRRRRRTRRCRLTMSPGFSPCPPRPRLCEPDRRPRYHHPKSSGPYETRIRYGTKRRSNNFLRS